MLAAVIAALGAAAVISPPVQTWAAQAYLTQGRELRGSVDQFEASFGRMDATNLHLEYAGAVLTAPSVQARIPVTAALLRRRFDFSSIVARGWTLDLSKVGLKREATLPTGPLPGSEAVRLTVERAVATMFGIVRGWRFPVDGSAEGLDLDGEVIVPSASGGDPVRMHVSATGGGLGAGRTGTATLAVTLAAQDSQARLTEIAAQGTLSVSVSATMQVDRVAALADFTVRSPAFGGELGFKADLDVRGGSAAQALSLAVSQASRRLAAVKGEFIPARGSFSGTWAADLRGADLVPFLGDRVSSLSASGSGGFTSDIAFETTRITGSAKVAEEAGAQAPLAALAGTTSEYDFDATLSGGILRFDRLVASLADKGAEVAVNTLQPVEFSATDWMLKPAGLKSDWIEVSAKNAPLSWTRDLTEGLVLPEGRVSGDAILRATSTGVSILSMSHVSVILTGASARHPQFGEVGFSAPLSGDISAKGPWHLKALPLLVTMSGRPVAKGGAEISGDPSTGSPLEMTCTWQTAPGAAAWLEGVPLLGWPGASAASGSFKVSAAAETLIEGSVKVSGLRPGDSLEASLHVDLDGDGSVSALGPVRIKTGKDVSDLKIDGNYSWRGSERRISMKVTGEQAFLAHIERLAGSLVAKPDSAAPLPFWGSMTGQVSLFFQKLSLPGADLEDAGGTLILEPGLLSLAGAHFDSKPKGEFRGKGSVSFDPSAPRPYRLKASATDGPLDFSSFLGPATFSQGRLIEGKFSVEASASAEGADLGELAHSLTTGFKIHGTNGIFRMLETSVADTIPEAAAPVKDALSTVGSAVGTVFGRPGGTPYELAKNPVSKKAEAVMAFTTEVEEVGYDEIQMSGSRDADGSIRIEAFELKSPDLHLAGTGRLGPTVSGKFSEGPLDLELGLEVGGRAAVFLRKAGLLSESKAPSGLYQMTIPAVLGGTLGAVDASRWHDALARVANAAPKAN